MIWVDMLHNHDLTPLKSYLDEVKGRGRTMLLPALHYAQSLYGWLPVEVQRQISFALRVPLADIHGVIEFYTMFYNEPTPKRVVRMCEDSACRMKGGVEVAHEIEKLIGKPPLNPPQREGDQESMAFEVVPCLGMCEQAPCGLNGERPGGNLTVDDIPAFLDGTHSEPVAKTFGDDETKWMLGRMGNVDPESLDEYVKTGGYEGLRKAAEMSPDGVIALVESFNILGRGGAQFPLGRKWQFTRGADGDPSTKHIVCNADESEPGTFKDRGLMEEDPFALIEAMTIAAYAVGAENGWIFVRGEYPKAAKRLQNAIDKARESGYLGDDILGKFKFDIEIRMGAGAYICGEETALFEAIEGKRGFPRIKPPYPTTEGLFGRPTAVNNVETLVAMLCALNLGGDVWRSVGTEQSPGTTLFCVSGGVARPGVYEMPFGVTTRQLIEMAGGESVQAVLMGGAAGVFIGEDKLDVPLTYEDAQEHGFPLGSGVIMVFDEREDVRKAMFELARFFAHESCGKCFPCQLGSQRQMEIMGRIAAGSERPHDRADLIDLELTMRETSLCGLGQTAGAAVVSAIELGVVE